MGSIFLISNSFFILPGLVQNFSKEIVDEQDINIPSVIEIKAREDTPLDFLLYVIPENRRRFSKYCNAIRYLNLI